MTSPNTNGQRRGRAGWLVAVAVGLVAPATAPAQAPDEVTARYEGLDSKANFTFRLRGEVHTRPVGTLNWTVPEKHFSTSSLGRTFKTYCAEPLVGVAAGNTYRFELLSPNHPAAYNLPDTEEGWKEAALRNKYIRELFGRYYHEGAESAADPDAARAFQVALWELTHETDLPAGPARFDLGTGTFRAEYPGPPPVFVTQAQQYLRSLSGDDSDFWVNLPGLELVRLNGLRNAAVVQGQYALQIVPRQATGPSDPVGGFSAAPGATTRGVIGNTGSPGAAVPAGGGASPFLNGSGGTSSFSGSITPNPTTPAPSPPNPGFNRSPAGAPLDPAPESSPVPGPSGLVLGGIAVAVFIGRRTVRQPTEMK
ncbi:MAG: hypothetical protein J0I06_10830 [Planctomycetes bacterium]|nr:hypothetical protein [Planctomycetota bacterium]